MQTMQLLNIVFVRCIVFGLCYIFYLYFILDESYFVIPIFNSHFSRITSHVQYE